MAEDSNLSAVQARSFKDLANTCCTTWNCATLAFALNCEFPSDTIDIPCTVKKEKAMRESDHSCWQDAVTVITAVRDTYLT